MPASSPIVAQNLSTTAVKATYAATGNGTSANIGTFSNCVASGAIALGTLTSVSVQLVAKYPGNAAPIAILSATPDSSTLATEHTFSSSGDWCLLTTNHSGGVVYVQIKGNAIGGANTSVTAYVQGVSP